MSKGGSTDTELPGYLQDFQKKNMRNAEILAQMGYMPYTGPEVAAVNPWEEVAQFNQGQQSTAFNMGSPSGSLASRMPDVVEGPDGSRGYSSFPVFERAVAELQTVAPQYDQRYKSLMGLPNAPADGSGGAYNLPSYGDPYANNPAMQALRDVGGVGPAPPPAVSPEQLQQLAALVSQQGVMGGSYGSKALQGLSAQPAQNLWGML